MSPWQLRPSSDNVAESLVALEHLVEPEIAEASVVPDPPTLSGDALITTELDDVVPFVAPSPEPSAVSTGFVMPAPVAMAGLRSGVVWPRPEPPAPPVGRWIGTYHPIFIGEAEAPPWLSQATAS